ncbi:MAG: DUF998 domain-containing protein [Vicinamibacterales bacterium]
MPQLLWGGVAGPILFATVATLCAWLRPGYSQIHQFISELGATGTANAWLMNGAGFVPGGLLIAGFGLALRDALPRRRLFAAGSLLVVVFGAGIGASGLIPCDVGCPQGTGSAMNRVHDRLGPLLFLAGALGAIVLGLGFRGVRTLRALWGYSVASGLIALVLLALLASTLETRVRTGLWQRLLVATLFAWCAVVAIRVARRGAASPDAAGPRQGTT